MTVRYAFGVWLAVAASSAWWSLSTGGALGQDSAPADVTIGQNRRQPGATQPGNGPSPLPPAGVTEVREVQPEVYYFRDRDGDLVPVPDITLEDLTRLRNLQRGLTRPERPPPFTIPQLTVEGRAEKTNAQLTIKVSIRVRVEGLIRVPLLLPDFVLQQPAVFQGPGDQYWLDYSEAEGGYVAWVHAPANTDHTLTLIGGAPLDRIGQETRLRLHAPRAVSPDLKIVVPVGQVRAKVVEGAGFLSTSALEKGQTQLNVQGLRGNLLLSWQPMTTQPARVMEVKGQILVKIMGPDEFQTEARLQVRSFGQPIDSFRVRLPAGHELVSKEVPEYTVTTLDPEPAENDASRIVEVKLTEKTEGPVVVVLETLLARPQGDPESPADIAGFEVLGTLRQSGEIAISVVGDWSLDWEKGPQVQRVGKLNDLTWPDRLDASFEYYRQPCSLRVRVWPMETHVSVRPTYMLRVDQHHVSLSATLHYQVQGASTSSLQVDMPGWQVQSVESEGRVDQNQLSLTRVNPLVIPLSDVDPGEFDIQVQARRPIDPKETELVFNLPRPHATNLVPATVVIIPAGNVQLIPRPDAMPYLTPTTLPTDLLSSEDQAEAFAYRDRGDQAPSRLACDIRVLPGTITVVARSHLHIGTAGIRVEQRFDYDVLYDPVDVLALSMGRQLAEITDWNLQLNGQPIDPRALRVEPADQDADRPGLALIHLPEPRYGKSQLEVQYELPLPAIRPGGKRLTIPLFVPARDERGATTRIVQNSLVVQSTDAVVSLAAASPWTRHGDSATSELTLVSSTPANQVELIVSPLRVPEPSSTVVDLAFFQTQLTMADRQDRAVFRLWTGEDHLQVTLPPGARRDATRVLLDGKPAVLSDTAGLQLSIKLSGDQPPGEHVLELIYPFRERPAVGSLWLKAPSIVQTKWTRQVYWQLITPGREHLLAGPREMTRAETWSWKGWFWGRRPLYRQWQLEQWAGAAHRPQPSGDVNQYLFSSFGSIDRIRARTGRRHLILAVCSGLVLVIGLVLIYVPVLRNPAVLLAATTGLVAAGAMYPAAALIVVQAGALGLVLVALARLLLWTVGRRHPQRPLIRGRSFPGPGAQSTELVLRSHEAIAHASSSSRHGTSLVSSPDAKP